MSGKVMLMWAGGKESALVYKKLVDAGYQVAKLCVLTDEGKGVYNNTLRGVRTQRNFMPIEVIQAQAAAIGVELVQISIADISSLREYYDSLAEWAQKCQQVYSEFKTEGGTHIAFGYFNPMCLESKNVGVVGLEPLYPLMGMTEEQIVDDFVTSGFKAKIIRTNRNLYGLEAMHHLCGCEWDANVRQEIRDNNISVIGEDGSFGTICFDGPIYNTPLPIVYGEVLRFNVDEHMSTAKLSDMNAFNVLQVGATRAFLQMSIQ